MAKLALKIISLKQDATCRKVPTAELETAMRAKDKSPLQLVVEGRKQFTDPVRRYPEDALA